MIVIDTETTGMGDQDQVIELGWASQDRGGGMLIVPTVPIQPDARASHHITDRELFTRGYNQAQALRRIEDELIETSPWVFHNAAFDMRMLRQTWPSLPVPPVICTWRCSLHLWPDAPSHSNQALRYWLDLPVVAAQCPHCGQAPHAHRAPFDASVTLALVNRMVEMGFSVEDLVRMSGEPVVLHRVRFGKHEGELWVDVPRDYLHWILRQGDFDEDVRHTAHHYFHRSLTPQNYSDTP